MYNPLDLSMQHRMRWLEFVQAIERQGWYEAPDGRVADSNQEMVALGIAARRGEHFFIERSLQDLVMFAERDMPDTVEFDMSWLLTEYGWLELAAPIADADGVERYIIGWCRAVSGDAVNDEQGEYVLVNSKLKEAVKFTCLTRTPTDCDEEENFCTSVVMTQDRPLALAKYTMGVDGKPSYCVRFLYALMHMLSERIAVAAPAMHRENVRGQAVARGIDPANRPSIIMLRRAAEAHGHEAHGPAHDFSCQWLVRGHWRQQPYPSVNEVRPVFIEAYIKGPADKPMKQPSPRVFVGRR